MKSFLQKCGSLLALLTVVVLSGLPATQSAEANKGTVTVLDRKRLGGYIEETTFIPNGPHANHIAMTNGYEILAVPVNANSYAAVKQLYDSRMIGDRRSRGLFLNGDSRVVR